MRRVVPAGASFSMIAARDGWMLRQFDWPSVSDTPRGSILFQTGRGDMIEKYFELIAHWHEAGWSITGFDWRGQGGSGRLLSDPNTGHINDFAIWTADLAAFWSDWQAKTLGPHIGFGHSMGGHLMLRALMEGGVCPDAVVLSAPMLGFETKLLPVRWIAAIVGLLAKLSPKRRAWPENERPTKKGTLRRSFLTHDTPRYEDELWWREACPELVLGPPSLRWLAEAYKSCLWIAAGKRLEAVRTPIILVGTEGDRLVSPDTIKDVAARLPSAWLHMFGPDVAHELLREVDGVRNEAIARIDLFLDEVAPRR